MAEKVAEKVKKTVDEKAVSPEHEAHQRLFDVAYRLRHMPSVKMALGRTTANGSLFHESFYALLEAIEESGKFCSPSKPDIAEVAKNY